MTDRRIDTSAHRVAAGRSSAGRLSAAALTSSPSWLRGREFPIAPFAPAGSDALSLDAVFGDAYGVQHHGEDSPQAIQSVAAHLLDLHALVAGQTTEPGWVIGRALRVRGVFHKLAPPPLGSALTYRHLFPGGGVVIPVTRSQYVVSVYDAWMALHRSTVEQWYERYVVPDRVLGAHQR